MTKWVQSLGPGRSAVQAASVLGGEVDLDLLADALRVPAIEVLGHLEEAAALGLVVEQGRGFAFRHDLVREVLEGMAGSARRAYIHRSAARSLEQKGMRTAFRSGGRASAGRWPTG